MARQVFEVVRRISMRIVSNRAAYKVVFDNTPYVKERYINVSIHHISLHVWKV